MPDRNKVEVLDFLMGYESYLRNEYRSQVGATNRLENIVIPSLSRQFACKVVDVFIYRFFTGLSLRLGADIFKVTAHERIQYLF
jgi:hypothetical protein